MERLNSLRINNVAFKSSFKESKIQQQEAFSSGLQGAQSLNSSMTANNLKAYFLTKSPNVSFGRKLDEHMSWGANVLPNGKVSFKVWAPHADSIQLEVRPKDGPTPKSDHTDAEVDEILNQYKMSGDWVNNIPKLKKNPWLYMFGKPEKASTVEMEKKPGGIYEITLDGVNTGDMYRYVVTKDQGSRIVPLKDPRSKSQPFDITGWSQVVNEQGYKWKNQTKWEKHPAKLRHAGSPDCLKPPAKMVCDEIHIGTFTDEGTFEAAKKKIDKLAKDGIYNTVELMPVNEFFGSRNWGYEGVDLYAPESSYGGPEKLKELVDYAHGKGMNVLLDVVYNHMGPFFNVVDEFGPYFDHSPEKSTNWGPGLNYEKEDGGEQVRAFVADNALHWLKNYNFDGLRLDMTQFMKSDVAMKEIVFEVRKHKPEAILIPEDGRNSKRVTQPIEEQQIKTGNPGEKFDADSILTPGIPGIDDRGIQRLGYDAQWNFDFQHTVEALATGSEIMGFFPKVSDLATEMYHGFRWFDQYGNNLPEPDGGSVVNYTMSHDEAGNRDGTRLITKAVQKRLNMFGRFKSRGMSDAEAGQKAAKATLELTTAFLSGKERNWKIVNKRNNTNISRAEFGYKLNEAKDINRTSLAAVFISPGAKMMLQGDEEAELAPMKFFSEYPVYGLDEKISGPGDKGYSIGYKAFKESKIGKKSHTDLKHKQFIKDVAKLFYAEPAMHSGERTQMKTIPHEGSKVLGIHRWDGDSEVFAVMNFGDKEFKHDNYGIEVPPGNWELVINSDDKEYGGNGCSATKKILAYGPKTGISLPPRGTVIYKKVK